MRYREIMAKAIRLAKRRGRPPKGGRDPHVAARMPRTLIDGVDAWAAANDVGRSEAIRRLVQLGLRAKK
jgi:hypothetical protein